MQKTMVRVDFQTGSGRHGRGHVGVAAVPGCAGVGFGAIWAGGFLPVEGAGAVKLWQAPTFAAALAPSMTLKSYWVQQP